MQSDYLPAIALVILIVIGSVLFFVALWYGIIYFASNAGGWTRIADKYPGPENFSHGRFFTKETGRFGKARYKHTLDVQVAPQGLYITSILPPQKTHPPLLIPWSEIKGISEQNAFGVTITNLTIGEPRIVTIGFWNPEIIKAAKPYMSNAKVMS